MAKKINIIVCCTKDNGIGKHNMLPWKIKEEMDLFKQKTIGNRNNCVIMGNNTFKSIPTKYQPLISRQNWILSTQSKDKLSSLNKSYENTCIFNTYSELIDTINHTDYDIYWVIGGESMYQTFMTQYKHLVHEIHISVLKTPYNCDTFFPIIDNTIFTLNKHERFDEFHHYVYKSKQVVNKM
jgi:dihydrofolate reductase